MLRAISASLLGVFLTGASALPAASSALGDEVDRLPLLIQAVSDSEVSPRSRAWIQTEIERILSSSPEMTERQLQHFRQKKTAGADAANQAWEKRLRENTCSEEELAALSPPSSDDEVIRIDTDLVISTVRAWSRSGAALPDLKAEELKLYVNGMPWEVEALDRGAATYEVVLLLDWSGSMIEMRPQMAAAARMLAQKLKPQDSMAVLAFAGELRDLTQGFQKDPDKIQKLILDDQLSLGGGSAIFDSLEKVIQPALVNQTARPSLTPVGKSAIRVVILLTDGKDTDTPLTPHPRTDALLKLAEESQALIYPVGFGTRLDNAPVFEDLARRSGGASFQASGISELTGAYLKIQQDLANLYRVSFKPLTSCQSHPLPAQCSVKIRVLRPESVIQGRTGYPCTLLKASPP